MSFQKVAKGSNYPDHMGKRCQVNAATFRGTGRILRFDERHKKYLVELDKHFEYFNPRTQRLTT